MASEYEASGLTQEEFSIQRNVSLKSLRRYVARYRKQATSNPQAAHLVAVEVTERDGGDAALTVVLPHHRRIEIKRGFDSVTLRQLVAVLEQA